MNITIYRSLFDNLTKVKKKEKHEIEKQQLTNMWLFQSYKQNTKTKIVFLYN